MTTHLSSPNAVWTVSELNRAVRGLLERELPLLWVSGEISNLTIAASGHCYLSLKDGGAQVRAVMFRNRALLLPFKLREGMKVEARVSASLYEARGDYQLNVETMRPAGLGALFEAFEKLKAQLAAEGLFDAQRKRPLPAAPRAIGIVTSTLAAALRDVLTTLRRRAPHIPVLLYPTPVQGEGAAERIAAMLDCANARREVDVLILCRGGGSIEDLWSFNEEVVARAIAVSTIPVVSGVGHETDFTIADFVADLRAPTPTAAAELVAPERAALLASLAALDARRARQWQQQWRSANQRLDYLSRRLIHPGQRLMRQRQLLTLAQGRLQAQMQRLIEQMQWRLQRAARELAHGKPALPAYRLQLARSQQLLRLALSRKLERAGARLDSAAAKLGVLDPQSVLARGYSIVHTRDGRLINDAAQLQLGEVLALQFASGSATAVVTEKPVVQGSLFGEID
ncbi:exodeoxyribonuclease VII large subunit [Chitinimonas sp.]|uniref:exodeoxyribonuclease VII large subunit n=1 Tax=Chitinimonas sp. TaxID=1934313 RepID=UPI0035AFB6F1